MAIPKQVEQAIKDVEELEKQLSAPVEEPTEETVDEAPPAQFEPQTVEVEPTQVVAQEEPKVDWEQKYRTIAGKYDAEVPRLHAQLKELSGQVQYLQQALETTKQPKEEPKRESLVTDADREAFGDDLIEVARKVSMEVASQYDAKLQAAYAKIDALERNVQQTGSQVGEMTFEQQLHRAVPDFDAVNTDPRWIAWLDEVLPDVGVPRRVFAERAYNEGNVMDVKRFVDVFRNVVTPKQPDSRKVELERQTAPSRNNAATVNPQQGKTYSQSQWGKLYDQVAMMNAKGKYDEAQKLEAELNAAYVQGRITA
jgi:hypothetical protein